MRRRHQGEGRPHRGLHRLREEAAQELAPGGADGSGGPASGPREDGDQALYKGMVQRLIHRARREQSAEDGPGDGDA